MAWHAKEVVRSIYDHTDPELAEQFVDRLGHDLQDDSCPPEVRQMGRTILRWRDQIVAWHRAHVIERADRSRQQPDQARQAGRVRLQTVPQLPDPHPALRRQAQLEPAPHHHTPLKSEEPDYGSVWAIRPTRRCVQQLRH